MALLNYSTSIAADRTVGEIQQLLGNHGADAVQVRYENREPVAVSFSLVGPHGPRVFTLPADLAGVGRVLREQHRKGQLSSISRAKADSSQHHARVAWRTLKDWLAAQLALVEANMARLDQVMLPYLHVDGEKTLYEAYQAREQAAIEAGGTS